MVSNLPHTLSHCPSYTRLLQFSAFFVLWPVSEHKLVPWEGLGSLASFLHNATLLISNSGPRSIIFSYQASPSQFWTAEGGTSTLYSSMFTLAVLQRVMERKLVLGCKRGLNAGYSTTSRMKESIYSQKSDSRCWEILHSKGAALMLLFQGLESRWIAFSTLELCALSSEFCLRHI